MSKMLEEAIVDAKALREAAIKDAEAMVVEKYSDEVRLAVQSILEQEDEISEQEIDLGSEIEEEASIMDDIPMAHNPEDEDEVVVLDLDQIIAAAEAEEDIEDQDFEVDAEEIADEVGISMDTPEPELDLGLDDMPANRDDEELELDESTLVDVFKEMLVVDIDEDYLDATEKEVAEAEEESEIEQEEYVSSPRADGMDKKDVEAHRRMTAKVESLAKENNDLKNILVKVKDRLEEVNLSNARLLYANRVLQNTSLNEQQKNKIVDIVSETRTVEEAKMVYETLQKTMASTKNAAPQSLSEAVSRKSSVILTGRRKEETTDNNPVTNRWATLAGIDNK